MSRRPFDNDHRLWLAVVEQAIEDLECEPWNSLHQVQAACFFLNDGPWGIRRSEVAEHLGLHGDDLRRVGRERLAKRQAVDPSPDLPKPASTQKPVPLTRPAGRPVDRKPPVLPKLVAIPAPAQPKRRRGGGHNRWQYNPFDPHRRLASEERAEQVRLKAAMQWRGPEDLDPDTRDASLANLKLLGGGAR